MSAPREEIEEVLDAHAQVLVERLTRRLASLPQDHPAHMDPPPGFGVDRVVVRPPEPRRRVEFTKAGP